VKPGIISDELRAALGLARNQIPDHVLQMKEYGYPPGWKEVVKSSGLKFIEDVNTQKSDDEDNDLHTSNNKIIHYPGLNSAV